MMSAFAPLADCSKIFHTVAGMFGKRRPVARFTTVLAGGTAIVIGICASSVPCVPRHSKVAAAAVLPAGYRSTTAASVTVAGDVP